MVTFHAGRIARVALLAALCACSAEQQDWRSAESADTTEAWGRFIEQHPDSELAGQARGRIAQLAEQRDWEHTDATATAQGYREFLAHHSHGKHAEEARIRIEAYALGSAPRIAPPTPEEAAAGTSGVNALQLATVATRPPSQEQGAEAAIAAGAARAAGGEAAQPVAAAGVALAAGGEAAQPVAAAGAALAAGGEAAQPVAAFVDTRVAAGPSPDSYGVQLGAFGSEASAGREWQRLQGRFGAQLGGLSPRIIVAGTDNAQLYRLQAPAAGEAQARALCDSLKEQAQACVPVVPR
ncbi:MAG TPA: SPOR domain-containing protein [Steroidobacteraceae bacterium]|jgi:hypothetical protein|nr:SPOR domain-containing protein [Steroidobacteraceae bacterium]